LLATAEGAIRTDLRLLLPWPVFAQRQFEDVLLLPEDLATVCGLGARFVPITSQFAMKSPEARLFFGGGMNS
jgi:hypothetical protein